MELQNPFPQQVRLLYLYVYACFNCGRSDRGLELHHILGRVSASTFNACPLCLVCHSEEIHGQDAQRRLFEINLAFLIKEKYRPTDNDYDFLRANPFLVVNNFEMK